jgi:hypothetical protein
MGDFRFGMPGHGHGPAAVHHTKGLLQELDCGIFDLLNGGSS